MKSNQLVVKYISSICSTLDTLYYINDGGCCFLAYVIAKYLEQEDVPYKVLIIDDKPIGKFKELKAVAHVCIVIKNDILNYNCDYDVMNKKYFTNITSNDLLNYYNKNNWCTLYNRAYNTFIELIFNKLMQHAFI